MTRRYQRDPDNVQAHYVRGIVRGRAGDVCQGCRRALGTDCHHVNYQWFNHPRAYQEAEGCVWFCRACHDLWHRLYKRYNPPSGPTQWTLRSRPDGKPLTSDQLDLFPLIARINRPA